MAREFVMKISIGLTVHSSRAADFSIHFDILERWVTTRRKAAHSSKKRIWCCFLSFFFLVEMLEGHDRLEVWSSLNFQLTKNFPTSYMWAPHMQSVIHRNHLGVSNVFRWFDDFSTERMKTILCLLLKFCSSSNSTLGISGTVRRWHEGLGKFTATLTRSLGLKWCCN